MKVAFCGHRELKERESIRQWLLDILERLIEQGAQEFLLGGYGAFDSLAAEVLQELKKRHPQIRRTLVLAYLDQRYDHSAYEGSVYPPLETVPKRLAIVRRNTWMVTACDVLVAYVYYGWGGSGKMLEQAERKKRTIICYQKENERSTP